MKKEDHDHPERLALYQAILESPFDDAPKLIYSDWLEDHGYDRRATSIRRCVEHKIQRWFKGRADSGREAVINYKGFPQTYCCKYEYLLKQWRAIFRQPIVHVVITDKISTPRNWISTTENKNGNMTRIATDYRWYAIMPYEVQGTGEHYQIQSELVTDDVHTLGFNNNVEASNWLGRSVVDWARIRLKLPKLYDDTLVSESSVNDYAKFGVEIK